jgi:hypothetical protein
MSDTRKQLTSTEVAEMNIHELALKLASGYVVVED